MKKSKKHEVAALNNSTDKPNYSQLSPDDQDVWLKRARYLIQRGYTTPSNNIDTLAEIIYNRDNDDDNR